jgi:curved DNA-binding protein
MPAKDYYKVLGIPRDASDKQIKSAFRKIAKEVHPDTHPNDPAAESKFKEANEAYEVLSDKEKRRLYDQFGTVNPQEFGGFRGAGPAPGGYTSYTTGAPGGDYGNLNDILEGLFGGGRRSSGSAGGGGFDPFGSARGPQMGGDVEQSVRVSLEEAYTGTKRTVVKGDRRVTVNIPAGSANGTKVRLAGEGSPGLNGGQPGDLYLVVALEPHPQFEVEGADLRVEAKVDAFTAMLGGEIEVPTLTRPLRLKIPAGTQSGRRFRLPGKGMPILRESDRFGDLYVRVMLTVPETLTDEQRALAERLRDSLSSTARA